MKPKVSIIIPCYNQAEFLEDALLSVRNQSYSNWECIIVNDGSTDNTRNIAQGFIEKDKRFKYYTKENGGISSARNFGLERASGDYIQFLDSDDIIAPNKLQLSLIKVQENDHFGSVIVVTNFEMFTNNITRTSPPYCQLSLNYLNSESVLVEWPVTSIPIHCGLFSAKLFENFRFPINLNVLEDWIMWVKVLKEASNIIYLDIALAFYRRHEQGVTQKKDLMEINLKKSIPYILELVSAEDIIYSSFMQLQKMNIEKHQLQKVINSYKSSKTLRFSRYLKSTKLGKLIIQCTN